ncbi:MAG: tyrosine-type recombinase/integrase [Coriobacteriales bacterium]
MDTRVRTISAAASEALRASGYRESTIRQYEKVFSYLEEYCPDGIYSEEAAEEFAEASGPDGKPYENRYTVFRRRIARLCADFVHTGTFKLGMHRESPPVSMPESAEMACELAGFAQSNEESGLAQSTCEHYWRIAREFCLFLESSGVGCARDADQASALGFLTFMSANKWQGTNSAHIVSNFRPFLLYLGRDDLAEALRLASPSKEHCIKPVFSDEEVEALSRVCCSRSVFVGDAAITLLALTTGMRASDIIDLRLSDVNWREMTISKAQCKTGNPLTVPMQPALADALAEYILEARPDCACDNVFVRQRAPYGPYADHSAVYDIIRRTLAAAGLEGGGTTLMRHNAASRMMRAGARLPVISAVLGQVDPNSADAYLEADEAGMASCVLPLPEGAML